MRNTKCGLRNEAKKQRGVSLIAAIFIIVILAFMGVMFVSLIGTSSLTSVNDLQSTQALSIAEGGMEYILKNRVFPNYSMGGATMNLGAGRFTVSTPTYLTADPGAAGTTINVQSTAIFPNAGSIVIDSELINYAGKNALQFTGATRGVGGTTAVGHTNGSAVYPVTRVTDNPLAIGSATINVTSNVGFSVPGVVLIDMEYIFCSGVNGTTQLTNCLRGYNGSPQTAHPNLSNVFQYALTSTGTVDNAQRAVERSARWIPGAMMVYAKLNGDPIPYCRRWDGTSWGPEFQATSVGAGRTIQYMVLKFARTRNEAVLGTLDSTGAVQVQVWNGAGWGPTALMGNTTAANSVYRGFDIEYETNGDRPIIVYNNNAISQVSYRIWNSATSTWSAALNIALPTAGRSVWIELASNPLGASNEIAMIELSNDATPDVCGRRWNGAAWDNMGDAAVWDAGASTSIYKAIHVAYEQQAPAPGRAMFVWGRNVNANIRFRILNGANVGAVTNQNIANIGNHLARWVRLAPDPYANNIMLGIQDSGTDLITSLWNGVAWDANGTQHDNSLEDASRNFDLVYETAAVNAGRAWVLWGNGSLLSRRQWNGAAWGGIATTGDDTSFVQMAAHPVSGAVLSGIYESTNAGAANRDIWESHLTQGSAIWSPRVMIWGGRTVAAPVMERLSLAAERYNPLIVQGWREVIR